MQKALSIIALTTSLLVSFYVFLFQENETKIAYINTGKLLEKHEKMVELKMRIKAQSEKDKAQIDTLASEFQSALQVHEQNLASMTKKEQDLSRQVLESKREKIIQFQQTVRNKTAQEEQTHTQQILQEVNAIISDYGEEEGYKLILATSNGNIAYGDKGVDITDIILKKINE